MKILRNPKIWLFLILFLAALIRFYRLPEYLQFLGDEGRDVLVVKRMIVDHKFTLLGPTASVGGFYTGPIYYYLMLPFLLLWQLNPVGPAVMAVIFGLATIVLVYFMSREFFGERAGLIAAFFIAISPKMIEISRFSWNPNPVPFFSLLTVFSLYLGAVKKQLKFTFLAGLGVGVLVQLHYINLVFIPIYGLSLLLIFPPREWLKQIFVSVIGFLAGNSLFLIFEARHGFPNTKSVIEFLTRGGKTVSPRSNNFIWLFNDMTRRLYETVLGFRGEILNWIYYGSVGVFIVKAIQSIKSYNRHKIVILAVWLLIGVLGVGSYRGTLYDHYFNYLFPLPFIFLGITGSWLLARKILWPVFLVLIIIISYFGIQKWYLWTKPNNLVDQTKNVDKIVLEMAGNEPYNFALITPGNSDHAYRYFLEVGGRASVTIENPQIDPDRKTVTNQLIVVCEGSCHPLGSPLWEVAGFGRGEIVSQQQAPVGITVYKLVHYEGK